MRTRRVQPKCSVCGQSAPEGMVRWRARAWLCPLHGMVARGLFPQPVNVAELRATFPARVTETRRSRVAAA